MQGDIWRDCAKRGLVTDKVEDEGGGGGKGCEFWKKGKRLMFFILFSLEFWHILYITKTCHEKSPRNPTKHCDYTRAAQ